MLVSIVEYVIFFACFGLSFYAISSIKFDRFCDVKRPMKVTILMFLLSLALAYLSSRAILTLTIYNGLGV